MAHQEFEALLERSFDGSLNQEEQARLLTHLETCAQCRFQKSVREDLRQLDEGETVPPAFSAAWREKIKEPAPVSRLPQVSKFVAMAATLVLLLIGAYKAGDLDVLGLRNAGRDAALSYGAVQTQATRAAEEAVPQAAMEMRALEAPKDASMDTEGGALYEDDAQALSKALPAPQPDEKASSPEASEENRASKNLLKEFLPLFLSLVILVLLILLIQEKRKQK